MIKRFLKDSIDEDEIDNDEHVSLFEVPEETTIEDIIKQKYKQMTESGLIKREFIQALKAQRGY